MTDTKDLIGGAIGLGVGLVVVDRVLNQFGRRKNTLVYFGIPKYKRRTRRRKKK